MGKVALAVVSIGLALTALTGCSAPAADSASAPVAEADSASSPGEPAAITASSIESIDDAIAWARGLDDSVTADELSTGIFRIEDLLTDLHIWFGNNEVSGALNKLNAEVLARPADAGEKVAELNAVVDALEAAIEKSQNP